MTTVIFLLSLASLIVGGIELFVVFRYLRRSDEMLESSLALIEAARVYAKSSDVQSRVTGRAVQEIRQAASITPEIAQKVEEVPQKTVELLKSGDSGVSR